MLKDEFIKIINSKRIVKVEADNDWRHEYNPEWCEKITFHFDDNTSININADEIRGQACLEFNKNNLTNQTI